MSSAARPDILRFVPTHVTCKTHVTFLFFFLPGKPHFFCIDDDHKIARIRVWCENGLLFTTQQIGCLYRYLSQYLVRSVDYPPFVRDFAGLCRKRFHFLKKGTKTTGGASGCQPAHTHET